MLFHDEIGFHALLLLLLLRERRRDPASSRNSMLLKVGKIREVVASTASVGPGEMLRHHDRHVTGLSDLLRADAKRVTIGANRC